VNDQLVEAAGQDSVARLRDLHVLYRTRGSELHAVRGVQLAVRRGEILALVGESGSGKTSIAMALLGLLLEGPGRASIRGEVDVLGVDLLHASAQERRTLRKERLGAVFQDPMTSLNPTMTIGRQLMEVSGTADKAMDLLDAVGVPEAKLRLRSYPHELSGGQRQRVMIAMAIAREPALVVADEPTTALDVTIQAQILQLLKQLRDELGSAFVLVTHDLGVASQIADRIVVCYGGRVSEVGPSGEVLARAVNPYTADLLQSRITLGSDRDRLLPTLPGEPPDPRRWPSGCPFAPRCAYVLPECETALPELVPAGDGILSACIRTAELQTTLRRPAEAAAWPAPRPESAADPVVLQLAGVHKTFRIRTGGWRRESLHALRGVELEVAAGGSVALVGESGCGKSTVLRAIAGLIPIDGGTIDLRAAGRPQMVFQDAGASLTPWLTVGEQVGERLRTEGLSRAGRAARIREALERVGLASDVARRKPAHLSGGQRQRVALARAVVVPPPVLLCDEPTSSLDVSLAATVLNLIGTLRRELNMAVLFVTHDLAAARYVADDVAVMYLGRIVEIGPAHEVTARPLHPYTKALLAAVPDVGRVSPEAKGELPSPLRPPSGCPYHPRCREAVPQCAVDDQPLRLADPAGLRRAACIHVSERAG